MVAVAVAVGAARDASAIRQSAAQNTINFDQPTNNSSTNIVAQKPISRKIHVLVTILTSIIFAAVTTRIILMFSW